jgi:hypothetical protein
VLPPAAADEVTALVQRLAALGPDATVDWSDAWSDQDLQEYTAASVQRLEIDEREDAD